jgi:hypothetical protein
MNPILILLPLLIGFTEPPKDSPADKLIGSWNLVQYKYGEAQEFSDVPEFIYYVKNITPTHFSWCSYNPENGDIIGTGGGTYEIDSKAYTESTEFWYPSGTNIPGTRTAFKYKMKGKTWTISGYVKQVEINPASGEMAPIDSTYISEVWVKLD